MKRNLALMVCAVSAVAVTLTGSSTPSAASARRCALPVGGHLVKRTSEALVYTKRIHAKGAPYAGVATIACAYRYGIAYRLNQRDDYQDDGFAHVDPKSVVLAGTVAASVQDPGCGACSTTNKFVSVRALRTGRVVHIAPRSFAADSSDEIDTATKIVLRRDAAMAFIYRRTPQG